jgi:hypothetical protein
LPQADAANGDPNDDSSLPDIFNNQDSGPTIRPDSGPGPNIDSDSDTPVANSGESWTFLVYMVADNDLEEAALGDLVEMAQVGSTNNFQIIVQADRADGHTSAGVLSHSDWTTTKRLRIVPNDAELLEDIDEVNMGDPQTLTNFIQWGISSYPADKYALIFWDHGGGWIGFGGDESTPNHDLLTMPELIQGVQSGIQNSDVNRFELIGFDACLMATYEVARSLKPYGNYLLSSEELEPGHGWDYESLRNTQREPGHSPVKLAEDLIEGYAAQAQFYETDATTTLSLVDLQKLDVLSNAVESLREALSQNIAQNATQIGRARAKALEFGNAPGQNTPPTDLIDLGHFLEKLSDENQAFNPHREAIRSALSEVIVSQHLGPAMQDATGLSLYFPKTQANYNQSYQDIPESDNWKNFLVDYYNHSQSIQGGSFSFQGQPIAYYEEDPTVNAYVMIGELSSIDSVSEVTIQGGIQVDENTVDYYYQAPGVYFEEQNEEGQPYYAAAGLWDGMFLSIMQGNTQDFGYYEIAFSTEGHTLIQIPFEYLSAPGAAPQFAFLVYVLDSNSGDTLQETWYLSGNNGFGELIPAQGSVIKPLFLRASGENYQWISTDNTFDPTNDISLELYFPQGQNLTLYMKLLALDVAGNGVYVTATEELGEQQ